MNGIVFQGEHRNTGAQDTEIDKLKEQVNIFRNDVASSFMPWILDVPQNSEFDGYDKAIPELASKVEKMQAVSNIYFLEPTVKLPLFSFLFHQSRTTHSLVSESVSVL